MKKFLILFVISYCIAFCAMPVCAQDESSSSDQSLVASDTSSPESQSDKLIRVIEIKGNVLTSEATIISKIKTRINQPYHPRVVKDDIKRLYDTGFFSDVLFDVEDYEDGLKVIITVEEKPIVREVRYEGVRVLRTDVLEKKQIKTKPGQYLDYNVLREDIATLKSEYRKRGYAKAEVDYRIERDPESQKADVVFVAKEHKRIRIKRVYFEGNENATRSELFQVIKTRPARIFHAGFFKEGEFQDDLERLKIFYTTKGFPDAVIDHRFEYDSRGFMYIYITISEGKKYTVAEVRIEGNKDFSSEELMHVLQEITPGGVYSEVALLNDTYNLRSFYLQKGYLFVQIQESASIDPKTGKVNVLYAIKENDIAYVERIDIVGNTKTQDKVIRREIRLKPGDRFDGDKLKRSKERIENLGFFEEVVFDTKPGTRRNHEDLEVEVKETQTGSFTFGGGYSSVDSLLGFIEIRQKNFDIFNFPNFTGAGQDLALRWETGTVRENYNLSFTEPWIFDKPISFGFDLYRRTHDRESDVGYAYNEKRTGGALRLGKEFSEYLYGNARYKYEKIEIGDFEENVTNELKKEGGETRLSSVELMLTRDTRDSKLDPTKGTVLNGSVEVVGGPFGGDKDFIKLYSYGSHMVSFGERSAIETKLRAGGIFTYGDTHDVPMYERYYTGGAYTIRGYNERKVGPIDNATEEPIGGESMLVGNIEYLYSLTDFFKVATFFDIGNTWRKLKDFATSGYKKSVGLGIRVRTPIGPLRLDYGYPLDTEPGEEGKTGKFHFSLSRSF